MDSRRVWRFSVVLLGVLIAAVCAAWCAEQAEQRLAELEKKIEALQQELAAARAAGAGVPADRLAELERRIELLAREVEKLRLGAAAEDVALESRYGLGPAASKVYGRGRGVSIGGYGEAIYQDYEPERDDGQPSGQTDSADLARVVFYFGYRWTDRWLFNSEIEYEHATTGEGAEEKGEVSVEFAVVEALLRQQASVRAGLVLIPMGHINEKHEPPVYLGARRPDVERVLIPATWRELGAGVFGEAGPFAYRAYVVTGLDASEFSASGIRDGRQGGSKSKADDLAFTGRLDWMGLPGLVVGGSFFAGEAGQQMDDPAGGTISARTVLWDLHAEWRWRGWQARGLYTRTSLDDVERLNEALGFAGADSIGERQAGYYGEAGFDLFTLATDCPQSLVLFGRYESWDTQKEVPAGFTSDPSRDVRVRTLGLSWKPIDSVVVKADYQNADNAAGTGVDQINLALGFMF